MLLAGPLPPPPARADDSPTLMLPAFPYRAKEFCIARNGKLFHLFYTRDNTTDTFENSTKDLGHAVSYDLISWTDLPPMLPVRADKWDNSHVWAPHIVATDSLYYMFYCGLTRVPGLIEDRQSIGIATSPDLETWTRLDAPVFTCPQAPWTYCDPSTPAGGNLRDPYVLPDPDTPGRWLLLYGAQSDPVSGQMMIGIATSDGDFTNWTDHGPLVNTAWPTSFSFLIESPLALEHDGLWYLFYTTDSGHPISYETTPDLLAPAAQWSPQRRLYQEDPNTDAMYGPDAYQVGSQTIFGAADGGTGAAAMWELVWDTPPHFHLVTPHLVAVPATPGIETLGLEAAPGAGRDGNVRLTVRVPADTRGRLAVYDLQGRVVTTLVDGALSRGVHAYAWHAASASGMYFARLDTPLGRRSARVALLH